MQAADERDAGLRALRGRSVLPLMLRDAQPRRIDALLGPRAATPGRRPATARSHRRCGATSPICGSTSQRTARIFHDDTGDPALTLDMYEDGDHLAREARGALYRDLRRPAAAALSVIFHSLDFVVFFVAVVAVYWMLPHRGQNVLLLVAQLFLLRLRPSLVPDSDRDVDGHGLLRRPRHGERGRRSDAASCGSASSRTSGCSASSSTSISSSRTSHGVLARAGHHGQSAGAAHRAAGRHLVLHVPGDELHDRRVSRRAARPPQPARRRRLRLVLSSPRSRSDSARLVPAAAGRVGAALLDREGARRGFLLICWGFFKKLVIADNVGVIANKVFALARSVVLAPVVRRVCLRDSDLRGLLRLHRHRARHVTLARVRADGELRSPVPGAQPGGFLAALEHLAVFVVPRLRLHSARRFACRACDLDPQRARDVPAVRAVARRELELRPVGAVSRHPAARRRSCRPN